MSKNKIIFSILGVILSLLIVFLVMTLNSGTSEPTKNQSTGDISIWLYRDDVDSFQSFLTSFKTDVGKYQNKTITVESFSDYTTYQNTLASAFIQGAGPDLFVLNNNETSIFENQIVGIDPNFISPNDFRKVYKGVFGDDLISQLEDDPSVEFLKGIPIGYETLGIYFNRRYFKSEQFNTWTSLGSALPDIASKNSSIIPIGLGNSRVVSGGDILMQIFLSLDVDNLVDTGGNVVKQGLQTYLSFGDRRGENAYNTLSTSYSLDTNLDHFSRGDVVAVAGYPSMLKQIEAKGYQKNFLLATPFPQYATGDKRSLINYNYFVVNNNSQNQVFINDLLEYMVGDQGITSYMKEFPYYLPASLNIEADILEKKIHPDFNIVYKDFINRDAVLASYNVGSKSLFDSMIIEVLGAEDNNDVLFENIKSHIICSTNKALTLTNLSSSCR